MKTLSKLTFRYGSITRVICRTVRSVQSRKTATARDSQGRQSYGQSCGHFTYQDHVLPSSDCALNAYYQPYVSIKWSLSSQLKWMRFSVRVGSAQPSFENRS